MKIFLFTAIFLAFVNLSFSQTTELGKSIYEISEYIANFKSPKNDIAAVDSIYKFALKVNNNNISDALLSLTFATIPYKEFPLTIPFVKIKMKIPIFAVNDSLFNLKNKKIPKNILFDSPQTNFGDKDKLAHFFGSAFISQRSNIFDFTKIIGIFVEEFEEKFKIDAKFDERDIVIDDLGNMFGKILKKNKSAMPSDVLLYNSLKFFKYGL